MATEFLDLWERSWSLLCSSSFELHLEDSMNIKKGLLGFFFCWLIMIPSVGSAYELVLTNESLGDGVNIAAGIEIVTGEIYAARFEAPADAYPMTLSALQVLMVPNPGSTTGVSCAGFELVVWKDGGTVDAGDVILDMHELGTDGQVVLINGQANTIQEVALQGTFGDVTLNPIEIESGGIRIGLRDAGPCPENASGAYKGPILVNDPSTAPANNSFLYGDGGAGPQWFAMGNPILGSKGEFVMRLVVDASGTPPATDTVSSTDTSTTNDSGSTTNDPGTLPDSGTQPEDTTGAVDTSTSQDSNTSTLPAPQVTDVLPRVIDPGVATDISITGSNFVEGATVELIPGAHNCSVKSTGEKVINAIVPATVTAGVYSVVITNPDGQQGLINGILTVNEDTPEGTGGGGCTATPGTPGTEIPMILLVGFLLWGYGRIRTRREIV
jgi:hypothetical protein